MCVCVCIASLQPAPAPPPAQCRLCVTPDPADSFKCQAGRRPGDHTTCSKCMVWMPKLGLHKAPGENERERSELQYGRYEWQFMVRTHTLSICQATPRSSAPGVTRQCVTRIGRQCLDEGREPPVCSTFVCLLSYCTRCFFTCPRLAQMHRRYSSGAAACA